MDTVEKIRKKMIVAGVGYLYFKAMKLLPSEIKMKEITDAETELILEIMKEYKKGNVDAQRISIIKYLNHYDAASKLNLKKHSLSIRPDPMLMREVHELLENLILKTDLVMEQGLPKKKLEPTSMATEIEKIQHADGLEDAVEDVEFIITPEGMEFLANTWAYLENHPVSEEFLLEYEAIEDLDNLTCEVILKTFGDFIELQSPESTLNKIEFKHMAAGSRFSVYVIENYTVKEKNE